MTNFRPLTIHEAEVAVWHAHPDGFPVLTHLSHKPIQAAMARCKTSVSISRQINTIERHSPGEWRGGSEIDETGWNVSLSGVFGQWDGVRPGRSHLPHGGRHYIVVVKWIDTDTGEAILHQFHYSQMSAHSVSSSGETMGEDVTFSCSHLEAFSGEIAKSSPSNLEPLIWGRVEWCLGDERIPCLFQNPRTGDWTESEGNLIDETRRLVYFGPSDNIPGDLHLSYLDFNEAGITPESGHAMTIPAGTVTTAFSIREKPSPTPGLILRDRHLLQLMGCPEVLHLQDLSREVERCRVEFLYLRRVYLTIHNGTIALPRLHQNQSPPVTNDPPFLLRTGGSLTPETLNRGLVLLPFAGYLDGKAYMSAETDEIAPSPVLLT